MQLIDLKTADELIDFSGGKPKLEALASQQLQGAVALHNMLKQHGIAYLADEVGMGKTYIALGVVALMRRFKPDLRVLYLLPKNNVRDKWEKDYKSFVARNYKLRDFYIKGLGDRPVVRYVVSPSLPSFINSIATDSARDHFICTSAFSFSLGNTVNDLKASLESFAKLLPQNRELAEKIARKLDGVVTEGARKAIKDEVKACWASALNAIMPSFDLVIVDEAHNLRKSKDSSDRNRLLATLMGVDDPVRSKARRVLLLSATPFDRDLDHLKNQLGLFGKQALLTVDNNSAKDEINAVLQRFMVRRLNEIRINDVPHTRNMYRDEHRSGKKAEIELKLEQQLFAAVLQKKVSESLQENCAGRFELGMLASFESYLPGEKGKPIEFDGQDERENDPSMERVAPDRNIVQYLVQDYHDTFERRPPHPKMDEVASTTSRLAFGLGKKQLIFVRRVRSVAELKFQVERAYDEWISQHIRPDGAVNYWFERYHKMKRQLDDSLEDETGDEESGQSSMANFFTWFYRGENKELGASAERGSVENEPQLGQLPHNFRKTLVSNSMMFEANWATLPNMPHPRDVVIDWSCGIEKKDNKSTPQLRFRHLQFAYLKAVSMSIAPVLLRARMVAERILNTAFLNFVPSLNLTDVTSNEEELLRPTLWNCLSQSDLLNQLIPQWGSDTFTHLSVDDSKQAQQWLMRLMIHQELIGVLCRIDHPFIDLYSLRNYRSSDESGSADQPLINAFVQLLCSQTEAAFSSYQILRDVADNLDLLIKLNFEDAHHKNARELTKYLTSQLSPLAPVIGATGENSSSRSPMARKFRMPGYPCVLISTDVFQEGEDLHTFCDSVVHYGISASPIALEQKIGRVDRIGSLSHRSIGSAKSDHACHYIQVTYPHIKQSMEFMQVRQAAANLNAFHASLHTIGTEGVEFNTELILSNQLLDHRPIPEQIRARLESPFVVQPDHVAGENFIDHIQQQQKELDERLLHVKQRVEYCLTHALGCTENPVKLTETAEGLTWGDASAIRVQVRSAQGRPDFLLSISRNSSHQYILHSQSPAALLEYLRALQANEKVRYQLFSEKNNDQTLVETVEIYAGGKTVLSDIEVQDVLCRLSNSCANSGGENINYQDMVSSMVRNLLTDEGTIQVRELEPGTLHYLFGIEGREQVVSWQVIGNHVLVTSGVINSEETRDLAENPNQLLNYTVRRNIVFDVVDFHINDRHELAVRATYPLFHLNQVELEFMLLSVAREADHLQYILRSGGG